MDDGTKNGDFKHQEALLKSYRVIAKTLLIRLELLDISSSNNSYIKKILRDKLKLYSDRIKVLEMQLRDFNQYSPETLNVLKNEDQ